MPVNIKDLIGEMGMQMDDYHIYLNKETCEIITLSNEELSIAEESEEDDDFSEYPDWQRESIQDALDVVINWDEYVELPDKWEIDEYSIMERFCGSIEDNRISNALYLAINGKGAFGRFKDAIRRYGIEQKWYSFHEEELSNIAIGWCVDNDIDYIE